MILAVRLFAGLREQAGCEHVAIELREGATVGEALQLIGEQHEGLAGALRSTSLVMAVNRAYVRPDTMLFAGDELALIPPVSGGGAAGQGQALVHDGDLSIDRLMKAVASPRAGAIVTFQGVTREVQCLEYEVYLPMATERIAAILDDAHSRHEIESAAAEHRIGRVPLGMPSVVVAVSAAHRGAAFAAAREVIDRIKAEAPIWKREIDAGHSEWVQGAPPPLE
jgi:molybdopterin synthase catalytic subunit